MLIPMTKKVVSETRSGAMAITKIGDSYRLTYHNPIYKGSPFKVPTSFSTAFSINEILKSSEVLAFMSRFN